MIFAGNLFLRVKLFADDSSLFCLVYDRCNSVDEQDTYVVVFSMENNLKPRH